jgi:Subtilase family
MRRRAFCLAALAALAMAAAPAAARPAPPIAVTVLAKPGQADRLTVALGATALRVQRRNGRELQVTAAPSRLRALADLPGAATARPATPAFEDDVIGEGFERTGAAALEPLDNGGRGLVIAILDQGFGTAAGLANRQARGELPPKERVENRSFDAAGGLAGSNAYGNATNHGELVAQTVYDYAPAARYIFVNYHTTQDFLAAVSWLAGRHPNIVVHSNSFLEGAFDGTGAEAQAVDGLAAAGTLWFNSAGNYAGKHWSDRWSDPDGDGTLDWAAGPFVFSRGAGEPVSFALSWSNPPGVEPSDLDLVLERQLPDGSWARGAASTDRQNAGAPPTERITGYLPPTAGLLRLRVVLASGPPPSGPLTLFSREIDLSPLGDSVVASLPTPGDANGSITVGAVDWRGNTLKGYSSQGPTADGRQKPDLVAPTNTRVAGPTGFRAVGGTSIAAPNAAGAAADLWSSQVAAGVPPTAEAVRQQLMAGALDLGAPGWDPAYGAGLIRVATDPPAVVPESPAPGALLRGVSTVAFDTPDGSRLAAWSVSLDGVMLQTSRSAQPTTRRLDTRRLADGQHVLRVDARDWPGNAGTGEWRFTVDNTPPQLAARFQVLPPPRPRALAAKPDKPGKRRKRRPPPPKPRPVLATVSARDATPRPMRLTVRLTDALGRDRLVRRLGLHNATRGLVIPLGRHLPGRYTLAMTLTDRAGNSRSLGRSLVVR